MNISMKWLKDYVDIDENMSIDEFCDAMTMSGTKVETYEVLGKEITNVVIGKILEIEKHPDADKLVVTKVDVGEEVLQIVTGANNITVGDIIPVAKVGATLADNLKIKKGKLRGVASNGMMCSVEELGLSREDFSEAPEDGIYIFAEEKPLGSDVRQYFGLDDIVVEYEITSNRPDSFSVLGVAREVAATFHKKLKMPEISYDTHEGNVNDQMKVGIENAGLCKRFVGRIVKDVKIEESPKWLKDKLRSCGVRPINNLVDITNFIMLELGQPMHAYDMDRLDFNEINVRNAKQGEKIVTLDGEERTLEESMLVIADKEKPIGIAGIMGGEHTKVLSDTKTIFFESANFDGTSIRKSSKKLGLRTDASGKYEKHLDPNVTILAMDRACQLIEMLGAGKVIEGTIDVYPNVREEVEVTYDTAAINKLLGTKIAKEEMESIFERLTFKVDSTTSTVKIPTYRPDIGHNADLAEEVARIYGYDNIPVTLATGTPTVGKKNQKQKIEDIAKRMMEATGISEALTYSFESKKVYDKLMITENHPLYQHATITNPLGEDFSVMRTTTLNGMLSSLATNYKYRNENVRLYEIGKTYIPKSLPLTEYPIEKEYITIGMYGSVDFFETKGVVETLLTRLGITEDVEYSKEVNMPFLHPGRKATICYEDTQLGYLGEVHPSVTEAYGIGEKTYVAILDMEALTKKANLNRSFKAVPKFPAVNRDLALLVKEDIMVGELEKVMKAKGGKNLESLQLFDVYQGKQIEEGYKSVAYAITFRATDRTLAEEEINGAMKRILKGLEAELGVTIRG